VEKPEAFSWTGFYGGLAGGFAAVPTAGGEPGQPPEAGRRPRIERRKELIKLVHHRGEEGRVAVRNIRRHSKEELEKLEREGGISEDDLVRSEKELQKLTDKHISDIDEVVAHKDAELKEI